MWSVPWGGVLALTGWLTRASAVVIGLTVAVSAVSAAPVCPLVNVEHHAIVAVAGVLSGLLVAACHLGLREPSPVP